MPASALTGRSPAPSAAHTRRQRDRAAMQQTINSRWSSYARRRPQRVVHWFHVSSPGELDVMRKTRILWLGVTLVAIVNLLLTLQGELKFSPTDERPERGDASERFDEPREARFDAPDAAARSDVARRQPVDDRL